jgi:hypothetical protein
VRAKSSSLIFSRGSDISESTLFSERAGFSKPKDAQFARSHFRVCGSDQW